MDGLRVYFDFTLSSLLLYNMERDQHDRVMQNASKQHQNKVKIEERSEENVSVEIFGKKNDTTLDEPKEKSEAKQSAENISEKIGEKSTTDESKGDNK